MELPSFLDEDIIYNPMYWLLTIGAEIALMIGFKTQSLWGTDIGMPFYSKLIVLLLVHIASYFIVMKIAK